jgi:putative transposase
MQCVRCGSAKIWERPERPAQRYRRFRSRACGKQSNERSAGVLKGAQHPSDVVAVVLLWRLRYKLSLRDLAEMFRIHSIVFSYKAGARLGDQAHAALGRELDLARFRCQQGS